MKSILAKRPVAFRVPRADPSTAGEMLGVEWRLFQDEMAASEEADALGVDYQALFVRDGTAIVAEWEPIASAPTDGRFLVCAVGQVGGPFVVSAQILWASRKENTPSHLGLSYVTHWMPLPAPPPLSPDLKASQRPTVSSETNPTRPPSQPGREDVARAILKSREFSDARIEYFKAHDLGVWTEACKAADAIRDLYALTKGTEPGAVTGRDWSEALIERVTQLKGAGCSSLSINAVLGLINFVRDGEGAARNSTDE